MRYTSIPATTLQPSVICLGTADLGGKIDRETSFRMLDAYLEQGGNLIDSASVYANWLPGERNSSEKTIGRWLAARGNRDRVMVATKGAHPELATMQISRMRRADIVADLDNSLANLQTDHIDLYWLHRDAPSHTVDEIIDTLNEQVQAGKIRAFGCSNWQPPRIQAAQNYAAQQGLHGFAANQPLWNIGVIDYAAIGDPTQTLMDDAMWQFHKTSGLAAIPYSSQANGLFNKLALGQKDRIRPNTQRMYQSPENQQRLQRIQQLSTETGLSITQIVLGYLTSQPFPTIPIVGCQNLDQLQDSLTAGDVQLSPAQVKFLVPGQQ